MPAAPAVIPADPKLWRKGFLDLRPSVVPCPDLTAQSWASVHEKCVDFLDRWAEEAAGLGWTTLDLFGVHRHVGLIRFDYCGGVVMSGDKVSAITASRIAFVNTAHYRDTPGRPSGAVPIWLFGR
ncbi:hypothetical protein PMNALOAF_1302 [Methylobacterium adhaesivum]|uniref:Uncharacterized protein n=1 Tax=Methylobacterium adhaesivum TaxID=333297 RepID=A0ABT8BIM4_9HYPH|nr:hypothetical protein [Methylobacterium adhaesivum]MDN3591337.1 hypothetical protein [Methylobacterium adhaesivum]GJD30059.1 hypothetical protein PMNALOAF_1302 [Methylobacterium adhaesivum]